MNQRIMEYAEQARLHATSVHPDNHDIKLWAKVYHEKFAELIIRECMRVVEDYYMDPCSYADEAIKEHFGVEE